MLKTATTHDGTGTTLQYHSIVVVIIIIFFQIWATRNPKRPHCSMSAQLSKHSNVASSLSALSVSIPTSQLEGEISIMMETSFLPPLSSGTER